MASARDVYGRIVNPAGSYGDPLGINKPPATADTDQLRVLGLEGGLRQTQLEKQRNATTLDKTDQAQAAGQQQGAIAGLQAAAAGTAPSAAQLQLQQQAQIDAARQIALAKAIGGPSAGGSAYRAAIGAANTNANAATAGAALKANEMAAARSQLADALNSARGQDIGAYKNDVDERNALLAAQIQQQQTTQGIAAANVAAQQQAAGIQNATDAAKIGAVGAGLGTYFQQQRQQNNQDQGAVISDYRAKRNIRMADTIRAGAR